METTDAGDTWYRLDRQDRLVEVGGRWREFARDNDAEFAEVIGASIFDSVAGHFTKRFLKEFFQRARSSGSAARMTYRCDSPRVKRLMRMRVAAETAGGLLVTHSAVDERALPFAIPFVEATRRAIAGALRCSFCNRLRERGAALAVWKEPESVVASSGVATPVIHTVCPDCRRGISARDHWMWTSPLAAR